MADRVEVLAAHLRAGGAAGPLQRPAAAVPADGEHAPLRNDRPGDQKVGPVPTTMYYNYKNFAPCGERKVELTKTSFGKIPQDLSGSYLRNGPNPPFDFTGKPYHPFDGDGMIHAVHFDAGRATYINKWVKTNRLATTKKNGFAFSEFGETATVGFTGKPPNMMFSKYAKDETGAPLGPSNTHMWYHAGRLISADFVDKPYSMDLDTLDTHGKFDFGGELKHGFAPHCRQCPRTGELYFFGAPTGSKKGPWMYTGVADRNLKLLRSFPIDIPGPTMIHDIGLSENYAFFLNTNYRLEMMKMMKAMMAGKKPKSPWEWHNNIPAQFGIWPRGATSTTQVQWIDVEPCNLLHFGNAWEEGDELVIYGLRFNKYMNLDLDDLSSGGQPGMADEVAKLHVWRLNLKTGKCVSERRVSNHPCDWLRIDHEFETRKCRYMWATEFLGDADGPGGTGAFNASGVVRWDLRTGNALSHNWVGPSGGRCNASEAVFCRRAGATEEGDGYLCALIRDEAAGASELGVLDARTLQPVAQISIPYRVPIGFHATWVGQSDGFPSVKALRPAL